MNIVDCEFDVEKFVGNGIIRGIFDIQRDLLNGYIECEKRNNGFETLKTKLELDNAADQRTIKDFAQRITEELFEMLMAKTNKEHRREEFADALSFATELAIMVGIDDEFSDDVFMLNPRFDFEFGHIIEPLYWLYAACNNLKAKSWKSEQILTDREQFFIKFRKFYQELLKIGMEIFQDGLDLFECYGKKASVNAFRLRSNY